MARQIIDGQLTTTFERAKKFCTAMTSTSSGEVSLKKRLTFM